MLGGSFIDRKHKRVHDRMTSQCLVHAVAGDQRTDRHLDTDTDVRATSPSTAQPFVPGCSFSSSGVGDLGTTLVGRRVAFTCVPKSYRCA